MATVEGNHFSILYRSGQLMESAEPITVEAYPFLKRLLCRSFNFCGIMEIEGSSTGVPVTENPLQVLCRLR